MKSTLSLDDGSEESMISLTMNAFLSVVLEMLLPTFLKAAAAAIGGTEYAKGPPMPWYVISLKWNHDTTRNRSEASCNT